MFCAWNFLERGMGMNGYEWWLIHPKLDRDFWRFFRFFHESIADIQFFSLNNRAFCAENKKPRPLWREWRNDGRKNRGSNGESLDCTFHGSRSLLCQKFGELGELLRIDSPQPWESPMVESLLWKKLNVNLFPWQIHRKWYNLPLSTYIPIHAKMIEIKLLQCR